MLSTRHLPLEFTEGNGQKLEIQIMKKGIKNSKGLGRTEKEPDLFLWNLPQDFFRYSFCTLVILKLIKLKGKFDSVFS